MRLSTGRNRASHRSKGNTMGGIGKNSEPPKPEPSKPIKPPPSPAEDDDGEDGDFATPKRDRYGDDDQPL
jgi:hypothetical protein